MPAFDLFTIGHSNIPAERFIALLRGAGVDAIADVRSIPASRFCPWFSAKNLAPLLAGANLDYALAMRSAAGRTICRSIATASPITAPWRSGPVSEPISIGCLQWPGSGAFA